MFGLIAMIFGVWLVCAIAYGCAEKYIDDKADAKMVMQEVRPYVDYGYTQRGWTR